MGLHSADDPRAELSELRSSWAYAFAHSSDCSRVDPSLAWVHEREHALLERIRRRSRVAHIAEDPARPRYGLCGTPLGGGIGSGSGRCVVCLDLARRGFVAR